MMSPPNLVCLAGCHTPPYNDLRVDLFITFFTASVDEELNL
jgi:hypothetical protein